MAREIPYYEDYVSQEFLAYLQIQSRPVKGIKGLQEIGDRGGLESQEALQFLCTLYDALKDSLNKVLNQRVIDRQFIDQRTRACYELNSSLKTDFLDSNYETIIGHEDAHGRIVMGPKNRFYCKNSGRANVADIPKYLQGHHVTLFGPPDDPKLSINAMNAFYRKLKDEPPIVAELLATHESTPKWGADDEDSKTPLRKDLISAGENLTGCFAGTLAFTDPKTKKEYRLEKEKLALPIKRFPGLALPCLFLLYRDNPLPLHLYDFALHLFENWHNPEALSFYVPKLETEEEAQYIHLMMETAEKMIHQWHPEYHVGSIRLFIVLENPRAIFRVNEIMDALYPYFAGASLGWHDYLASTARVFKEDANYRIPVKADPNIVIKYIKASHLVLSEVVGSRGGIKIGGMYGILPIDTDLFTPSFQVTIKGFIKDVVTQLKRDLSGFWVAHPDFIRIGLALIESWKFYQGGDKSKLHTLVTTLLEPQHHQEILKFIEDPDLVKLDVENSLYPRTLIVADIKESDFIANNDPEEIRYNVFQSLQYLTDWLSGNGCVALPAQIGDIPVRVMDDLATAERSRWEVWHEIHHGRFSVEEFLKIAHEELLFIRKDLSNTKKIVQVKWDERTAKWYPVAMQIMIQLMTSRKPVEFATELLLPFTIDSIRNSSQPWDEIKKVDPEKYSLEPYIERFDYYFSICGSIQFAKRVAEGQILDLEAAENIVKQFDLTNVKQAAYFHGDIGETKKTLDEQASREQALVFNEDESTKKELKEFGAQYIKKFGVKFLISAQNKSGKEILSALKLRLENSAQQELENARIALWEISLKRLQVAESTYARIAQVLEKHKVLGAMVSVTSQNFLPQTLCFGERVKSTSRVTKNTWFEIASLSKTLASCFAIEYFRKKDISLQTSVNALFAKTSSPFRLKSSVSSDWAEHVSLEHLMSHSALNLHYVNGVPSSTTMPNVKDFLNGNSTYGYQPIDVINSPGTVFQYSGAGFLVLEHLIESLEKKSIQELTKLFFDQLGLKNLSFEQKTLPDISYANGYLANGNEVESGRKMFPAFAAGAMGTAHDVSQFLSALTQAYHSIKGAGPISHDTATHMLFGTDKSSLKFMGAKMGLGIFIAEAGPNRLAIHQGANDGFRCLFVHCFDGPDKDKGFVILCNADTNGVLFNAEVAQILLEELKLQGLNTNLFKTHFDFSKIPQQEVVNLGYKNLIFDAFEPDLPEEIIIKGPLDPLASYNLCIGSKIIDVSNQRFARAENLLSAYLPVFDPELYGRQGKIMDSWESVRHNPNACDELIFELRNPSEIHYVSLSTKYHNGNHPQDVQIEGFDAKSNQWQKILVKTDLQGHALRLIKLSESKITFQRIKVSMFPDGGLTRLGLYKNLPENEKQKFLPLGQSQSHTFAEPVPHALKPLTPKYKTSEARIKKNWDAITKGQEVDVASLAFGGKIISASNEHYGPAAQIISPFPPLNMFDGFESARSRDKGHYEDVIIGLAKTSRIHRIEVDFMYFINNNPMALRIHGLSKEKWIPLTEKTPVKMYAGNTIAFPIETSEDISQIKITVYPDGGMNRVRAYTVKN